MRLSAVMAGCFASNQSRSMTKDMSSGILHCGIPSRDPARIGISEGGRSSIRCSHRPREHRLAGGGLPALVVAVVLLYKHRPSRRRVVDYGAPMRPVTVMGAGTEVADCPICTSRGRRMRCVPVKRNVAVNGLSDVTVIEPSSRKKVSS
jgi:hypothetical protein